MATWFVATAGINLAGGAALGGWMAANPSVWPYIGAVHGELNPFGWLTLLIYGMTYAVLAYSAGLRPRRREVGWIHWLLAELGVVLVTAGELASARTVAQVGMTLQALAPIVFLGNILSAVAARRRAAAAASPEPTEAEAFQAAAFLWKSPRHQLTDRVARRGTDMALMVFIVAAWWMTLATWATHAMPNPLEPAPAVLLVYYGWIAGTVLAVSLHLLPRLSLRSRWPISWLKVGQVLWGLAVLCGLFGGWLPASERASARLFGAALLCVSVTYLITLAIRPVERTEQPVPLYQGAAWVCGFGFAAVLGALLLLGVDPLSLLALHLLFLGWITTLVYGIGHSLFPLILRRKPAPKWLQRGQLTLAVTGAGLMAWAFSNSAPMRETRLLLCVGGVLAACAALIFLASWLLARPAEPSMNGSTASAGQ